MENVVEQAKPEVDKVQEAAVEEHNKLQEALHRVMLAAVGTVGLVQDELEHFVNKAVERPVVQNGTIAVRRMMDLSSSFDHRFVDGFDAAAMIQALKDRLEHPATIFIQD